MAEEIHVKDLDQKGNFVGHPLRVKAMTILWRHVSMVNIPISEAFEFNDRTYLENFKTEWFKTKQLVCFYL